MTPGRSSPMCALFSSTAVSLIITATTLAGFPAENVVLRSLLRTSDFGASFAEDCWGYVSESGREYAIIGLSNGTGFVEITDPDNPVIVSVVLTPNRGRDMKVYQHYVYSSSDCCQLHVIDVAEIDNGMVTLVNSLDAGTHNIFINEQSGFLYASTGGTMVVWDLSDPINPAVVGIWGIWEGQAHDATVITYKEGPYAGREIAFVFAGGDGVLDIVDVTDKSNMFLIGQTSYPNAGFTHQGWLTADRQYLYVSDEGDNISRTTIIDVNDLSNPTFISDFTTGLNSTDHNLYVRDGYIFEANYSSGLRIFDTANPVFPVEVGYFDTFPAHNSAGFEGAWSAYPFFPSGTVIVSDRAGGLFILDPSEAVGGGGRCSADFDGSGGVGAFDLAILLGSWGPCVGCPADFDDDGDVDAADLAELLGAWGLCP